MQHNAPFKFNNNNTMQSSLDSCLLSFGKAAASFRSQSPLYTPCLHWYRHVSKAGINPPTSLWDPQCFTYHIESMERRRVSSVVEHSSANPNVPGLIPGLVSYRGREACFMHLTPGVVHNFPKAVGV